MMNINRLRQCSFRAVISTGKIIVILSLILLVIGVIVQFSFGASPSPDLAVTDLDIKVQPVGVARVGQPIRFTVIVRNVGNAPTGRTYLELDVTRYGDPHVIWVGIIDNLQLKPGQKVTREVVGGRNYSSVWQPDKNGIYITGVCVDPENAVLDTSRKNNRAGTAVQVGMPDFQLRHLVMPNITPVVGRSDVVWLGKQAPFSATVSNLADGPFSSYAELEITSWRAPAGMRPEWVGTFTFDLAKGASHTGVFAGKAPFAARWTPKFEGMYIAGAIADPPYTKDGRRRPQGDILERVDTDPTHRDESKRQGNNADYRSINVYKGLPSIPGTASSWIVSCMTNDQAGGPGSLVRSYGIDATRGWWNAYAYDQGLAVISLVLVDDFDNARKLLDELRYLQQPDGAFPFCWYAPRPKDNVLAADAMVGSNAWIILAVAWYTQTTGQRDYVSMAQKCADWALKFQVDANTDARRTGGVRGGIRNGNPIDWMSVEHNLDLFAALTQLHQITGDPRYEKAATNIRDWLAREAWNEKEGRFNRGFADSYPVLDVNTWGVLALGKTGPHGEDYTRGLQWCLSKCLYRTKCQGNSVEGFDFNFDPNSDYSDNPTALSTKGHHSADGVDTLWLEGTAGYALAALSAGDEPSYTRFYRTLASCRQPDGAVPYATSPGSSAEYTADGVLYPPRDGHDDTEFCSTASSIAGTAWLLFAERRVNPFRPDRNLVNK